MISDLVGDNYQQWRPGEHVVFDAATGSGKTYFCWEILAPYAEANNKNILYLYNRLPLGDSIKENYGGRHTNVRIMTYQALERMLLVEVDIPHYDYIIADECHYFVSDSLFNELTGLSYEWLYGMQDAVVIWMSGTMTDIFNIWIGKSVDERNYYQIENKYEHISRVHTYYQSKLSNILTQLLEKDSTSKIVVFVNSLDELDNLRMNFGNDAHYMCSRSRIGWRDWIDPDAIRHNTFEKRMLITTSVADNGVDLKDPAIKYIFCGIFDLTSAVQAVGRKRPISATDTCELYLRRFTKHAVQKRFFANKEQFDFANDLLARDPKAIEVVKRVEKLGEDTLLDNYPIFNTKELRDKGKLINYVRYAKLRQVDRVCGAMLNTSYLTQALKAFNDNLNDKVTFIASASVSALSDYLVEHENEKLFDDGQKDLQTECANAGFQKRSDCNIGIRSINKFLLANKIPFFVDSKREKSRKSEHRDEIYWIVKTLAK